MTQILFKNERDISSNWLFYIENEAMSLSRNREAEIESYIDRKIFNPEMQDLLKEEEIQNWLSDMEEVHSLVLNYNEGLKSHALTGGVVSLFKKLKLKTKKIFCKVVRDINGVDVKAIISATLTAILATIGIGVSATMLPIIVGLIALLLKNGVDAVCPI